MHAVHRGPGRAHGHLVSSARPSAAEGAGPGWPGAPWGRGTAMPARPHDWHREGNPAHYGQGCRCGIGQGGGPMGWVESGQAWGERAADWAYLNEPYARRANDALFDRAGVGPGTRLLDIACGSGYAASVAAGRGARFPGSMPPRR